MSLNHSMPFILTPLVLSDRPSLKLLNFLFAFLKIVVHNFLQHVPRNLGFQHMGNKTS